MARRIFDTMKVSYNATVKALIKPKRRFRADVHSPHLDILDLLDWEINSLKGLQNIHSANWTKDGQREEKRKVEESCHPPTGVSETFCLGTFSFGGGVQTRRRFQCEIPMQGLEQLRQSTRDWFQNNPLPSTTTTTKCDVCQIMELARMHNLSIALIGDSMHSQVAEGLGCELQRRNYIVNSKWNEHTVPEKGNYKNKHHSTKIMKVRSRTWSEEDVVTMKYHLIYKVPLLREGEFLALTKEADVVVLGFGLHWWYKGQGEGKEKYSKDMAGLFRNITDQGHVKLLVHRETSAQHFDADGGEYSAW